MNTKMTAANLRTIATYGEAAISELDSAIGDIENVISSLETAKE